MNEYEIPIIASSATSAGSYYRSADGSSFSIILEEPIVIPNDTVQITSEVQQSTIWWTVPNISAAIGNNHFHVEHNAVVYDLTILDGLYSLIDLNTSIDRALETATGISGLVTLEADNATNRVNIQINVATVQIDFTQADTFRDILGFNSQLIPTPNPSVGVFNQLGDVTANFNAIEYFLIHTDLVNKGILINSTYSQVIDQTLIDVSPGSQIVSSPFNPTKVDSTILRGTNRSEIRFWLTDQNNNLIENPNEDWSCKVVIRYKR